MKQYHIFFSGNVQGVGFRFTTDRIAQRYKVCGWVQNCTDGRVELHVEGRESEIVRFLEDVETHFEGYIASKSVDILDNTDEFKDFRIRS